MGFGERRDQAALGDAGHRMLSHHTPHYGAVPPPHVGAPMMAQQVFMLFELRNAATILTV